MPQCALGKGVNKEYFLDENEVFSVCPDCLWEWALFLTKNPSRTSAIPQAEAIATMRANAIASARLTDKPIDFLRQLRQNNSFFKRWVIHDLQHAPNGPR